MAAPTLEAFTKFIAEEVDPTVDTFFIDPEESNTRAKHVYEKAGFQWVSDFHRDYNGKKDVRHFLMIKKLNVLHRTFNVEIVSSENQEQMLDFLKDHDDYSLF